MCHQWGPPTTHHLVQGGRGNPRLSGTTSNLTNVFIEIGCHLLKTMYLISVVYNLCKELLVFQDFQISNIGDKSTLTITEVFPEDEGHYSCKAVNIEGEITSTCQLLVEGRLHPLYKQKNLLKSKPNLLQGFHSISYVRNKF